MFVAFYESGVFNFFQSITYLFALFEKKKNLIDLQILYMRGYNSANLFFIQKTDLIELQSSRKMNLAGSAETSLCTTNIGESLSQTHSELLSSHVTEKNKYNEKIPTKNESQQMKESEKNLSTEMKSYYVKYNTVTQYSQTEEKDELIRKMANHIKHIWNIIFQFGDKLNKAELLTEKEKLEVQKEYESRCLLLKITQDEDEKKHEQSLSQLLALSSERPSEFSLCPDKCNSGHKDSNIYSSNYHLPSVSVHDSMTSVSNISPSAFQNKHVINPVVKQSKARKSFTGSRKIPHLTPDKTQQSILPILSNPPNLKSEKISSAKQETIMQAFPMEVNSCIGNKKNPFQTASRETVCELDLQIKHRLLTEETSNSISSAVESFSKPNKHLFSDDSYFSNKSIQSTLTSSVLKNRVSTQKSPLTVKSTKEHVTLKAEKGNDSEFCQNFGDPSTIDKEINNNEIKKTNQSEQSQNDLIQNDLALSYEESDKVKSSEFQSSFSCTSGSRSVKNLEGLFPAIAKINDSSNKCEENYMTVKDSMFSGNQNDSLTKDSSSNDETNISYTNVNKLHSELLNNPLVKKAKARKTFLRKQNFNHVINNETQQNTFSQSFSDRLNSEKDLSPCKENLEMDASSLYACGSHREMHSAESSLYKENKSDTEKPFQIMFKIDKNIVDLNSVTYDPSLGNSVSLNKDIHLLFKSEVNAPENKDFAENNSFQFSLVKDDLNEKRNDVLKDDSTQLHEKEFSKVSFSAEESCNAEKISNPSDKNVHDCSPDFLKEKNDCIEQSGRQMKNYGESEKDFARILEKVENIRNLVDIPATTSQTCNENHNSVHANPIFENQSQQINSNISNNSSFVDPSANSSVKRTNGIFTLFQNSILNPFVEQTKAKEKITMKSKSALSLEDKIQNVSCNLSSEILNMKTRTATSDKEIAHSDSLVLKQNSETSKGEVQKNSVQKDIDSMSGTKVASKNSFIPEIPLQIDHKSSEDVVLTHEEVTNDSIQKSPQEIDLLKNDLALSDDEIEDSCEFEGEKSTEDIDLATYIFKNSNLVSKSKKLLCNNLKTTDNSSNLLKLECAYQNKDLSSTSIFHNFNQTAFELNNNIVKFEDSSSNLSERSISSFDKESIKCRLNVPNLIATNTEMNPGNLNEESVELLVKDKFLESTAKRKRTGNSDLDDFAKNPRKKSFNDLSSDGNSESNERINFVLPEPSVPVSSKNYISVSKERLSSTVCNINLPVKSSLKRKLKPLDDLAACVAPTRVRGRTSEFRAFFKKSVNEFNKNKDNGNKSSNSDELQNNSLKNFDLDKNVENYISTKKPKIRKEHQTVEISNKMLSSHNTGTHLNLKEANFEDSTQFLQQGSKILLKEQVSSNFPKQCPLFTTSKSHLEVHSSTENRTEMLNKKLSAKKDDMIIENNKNTDVLPSKTKLKKAVNLTSFMDRKDSNDQSLVKPPQDSDDDNLVDNDYENMLNIDNNIKYLPSKNNSLKIKKTPLNSNTENVMKKQKCSETFESTIVTSSSSKNISLLNKNSVNDSLLSRAMECDENFESDSDRELVIDECVKEKDTKFECPELCSSSVDLPPDLSSRKSTVNGSENMLNIDKVKFGQTENKCLASKKMPLDLEIESLTKQNCGGNPESTNAFENTIIISSSNKHISLLNENFSVNNSSLSKTMECDGNFESDSDRELIIDESIKQKDPEFESPKLCSSIDLPPDLSSQNSTVNNNENIHNIDKSKFAHIEDKYLISKEIPSHFEIECPTKKQNYDRNFEIVDTNSSTNKDISALDENLLINDDPLTKTIKGCHFENDSDKKFAVDKDDNGKPKTYDNLVDEHLQSTSGKSLSVESKDPDLLEESYNFVNDSYKVHFQNMPTDNNETNVSKLLLPAKRYKESAETLSCNKSESPPLDKIPSENIFSNISISSLETSNTDENTDKQYRFSVSTAPASKILSRTDPQDLNQSSIAVSRKIKTVTTSNSKCKNSSTSCDPKFSRQKLKHNEKERFIKKGSQKFQHTKLVESILKNKNCKSIKDEDDLPFSLGIEEILDGIKLVQMNSVAFKSYVDSLVNFLTIPQNAPDTATLIFLVVHYLHLRKANPLQKFLYNQEAFPFMLSSEKCIVTALIQIEKMTKPHLQGLLKSLLSVLYHLILEKRKLNIYGISSLCRVFTELCKHIGDKQNPLSLCCDLLKQKHWNSPFLIASIAGVWKELFEIPDNFSDEQITLLSSIMYGAQTRIKKTRKSNWECSFKLIEECIAVPSIPNAKQAIELLKEQIVSKSLQNSFENIQYLTSSLVILASREPWNWTQQSLLNDYIVTNLKRFSSQDLNEQAFDLFCNLYVDVYFLAPTKYADEILIKYVEHKVVSKEKSFVQDCSAAALMKYLILARREIPVSLTVFFEKTNSPKIGMFEDIVRRRRIHTSAEKLSIKDIMIFV
ncbi:MATH and LRR domain-containing protein PFE0570w-like isoform X2 [Argiope bruennichi]|uniref:MATH and LRR domain-containing protein PFE0570w-like isoform X2 n=1 Tax=Argiope bruennichi TaxID=94029 RepID=UPI002495A459|nr:MATH and LRR domain-containing protein PFE0570w-like isoform X2 [Argiope bruennichi]